MTLVGFIGFIAVREVIKITPDIGLELEEVLRWRLNVGQDVIGWFDFDNQGEVKGIQREDSIKETNSVGNRIYFYIGCQ
jgi:hypothetical protein